jgi:hypothetical protein
VEDGDVHVFGWFVAVGRWLTKKFNLNLLTVASNFGAPGKPAIVPNLLAQIEVSEHFELAIADDCYLGCRAD